MKELLIAMVDDIQDLRASLDVVAAAQGRSVSIAEARDAKKAATQTHKEFYDKLRAKIEQLSS